MAKRFRFTLDPLLRVRRLRADAQRRVVARHVQAVERSRAHLGQLQNDAAAAIEDARRRHLAARFDAQTAMQDQHYRALLRRQIAEERVRLADAQRTLRQQQTQLAECRKDVKIVEKLRQRRWGNHVAEMNRAQQAELDDIAGGRAAAAANDFVTQVTGPEEWVQR